MQPTAEIQLEGHMYKNVLVALNNSQAAERALNRAIAMAEIEKGDLFVVVVNEALPILEFIIWAVSGNFFKKLGFSVHVPTGSRAWDASRRVGHIKVGNCCPYFRQKREWRY